MQNQNANQNNVRRQDFSIENSASSGVSNFPLDKNYTRVIDQGTVDNVDVFKDQVICDAKSDTFSLHSSKSDNQCKKTCSELNADETKVHSISSEPSEFKNGKDHSGVNVADNHCKGPESQQVFHQVLEAEKPSEDSMLSSCDDNSVNLQQRLGVSKAGKSHKKKKKKASSWHDKENDVENKISNTENEILEPLNAKDSKQKHGIGSKQAKENEETYDNTARCISHTPKISSHNEINPRESDNLEMKAENKACTPKKLISSQPQRNKVNRY